MHPHAAGQGFDQAQFSLRHIYQMGEIVPPDPAQARDRNRLPPGQSRAMTAAGPFPPVFRPPQFSDEPKTPADR